MELRDIEYFAVIAEHGHLGRAAETLGLSQPALSKSLRRLEEALRVKLVKRTAKGVELTPEGSVLVLRVRELRLSLQSIGREITEVKEGRIGHVRLGVGFPGSEEFLSAAFAMLLEDAPHTRLMVSVSDNDVMIPALRNGELDLIVNYYLGTVAPIEGLVFEHLYDDENVVCASVKHRLAIQEQVTLAELAKERWALTDPALALHRRLHEKFRDDGLGPPNIALEARSAALRLRTVASSHLLDWTSRKVVEQSALASEVKILPIEELTWRRPVGLIYRRENYLPPAVSRFIEILKASAKEMTQSS
jgi:DNA-binding transcriptional LysR family regulator